MGVEEGVEALARRSVAEDDVGERGAVQDAVSHDRGPDSSDFEQPVALGRHDLTGDDVGVDDESAEVAEDAGDLTLSSADAAGQPNAHGEAYSLGGGSGSTFDGRHDPAGLFLDRVFLDLLGRHVGHVLDRGGDPPRRVVDRQEGYLDLLGATKAADASNSPLGTIARMPGMTSTSR